MSEERRRWPHFSRGRSVLLSFSALLLSIGIVAIPSTANAYVLYGWHWASGDLRVHVGSVSGKYRTAISQAGSNITASSDVSMTFTNEAGPSFTAYHYNAGKTGYEGWTDQFRVGSRTQWAHSYLNTYYASSYPTDRLKVIWLHELSHGLGLNHVSSKKQVMYRSASVAYASGVRNLTTEEVRGLNVMY
jgi:hypothetical protein